LELSEGENSPAHQPVPRKREAGLIRPVSQLLRAILAAQSLLTVLLGLSLSLLNPIPHLPGYRIVLK
jgi:hypothetical protein